MQGQRDRDVHEVPADADVADVTIAVDAMSDAFDSAELFHVQMQQFTRMLALVASHGHLGLKVAPARETRSPEDARNAGTRDPQVLADEATRAALPAQRNHLSDTLGGKAARTTARPAGSIQQSQGTFAAIAAQPFLESRQ